MSEGLTNPYGYQDIDWASQLDPEFARAHGVLLPIGQTALTTGPISVVLARWFPDMRGRAIALADIGAALGLGLYPPLSQWLMTTYGWRWAFIWLALSVLLLVVPLTCWQRAAPTCMWLVDLERRGSRATSLGEI